MEIDRETAIQTLLFDEFVQTYPGPALQRAAVALAYAKIRRDIWGPEPATKLVEDVNSLLKTYDREIALEPNEWDTYEEGDRKDLMRVLEVILQASSLKLKVGSNWETDLNNVIKELVGWTFEDNLRDYKKWEEQARDTVRKYWTGLVRQEGGFRVLFLEARRRALDDPAVAEALHQIFQEYPERFDSRDLPSVIDNPRRKRPVRRGIKDRVQPDGRIIMSIDDMIALVDNETDGLRQVSSALLSDELMAADAKQQDFIAWMQRELDGSGNPERAEMEARAEAAVERTLSR